jgi:membrane-associated phospholipid phosphatase
MAIGIGRSLLGQAASPSDQAGVAREHLPHATTLDERVRAWVQAPAHRGPAPWRLTMRAADVIATPGLVVAAPLAWGAAAVGNAPTAERVARRTTEAVLVGAATTGLLKMAFGRARPMVTGRSSDWQFGRGVQGGAYQAFPSGHTTVAFAAASTWVAESQGSVPVVAGAAAFAVAAGVARLYFDKHWLTDVLAGAAVGTLSAMAVQAAHRHALRSR